MLFPLKNGFLKNTPLKIFLLVLLVAILLLPWRWMPALTVGGYEVKRVDLLSDVLPSPADSSTSGAASLPALKETQAAQTDSCPKGMVCIDDYALEPGGQGMTPFYAALGRDGKPQRPVRVAYLGDSFIEVDILSASLRRMLQERYGGAGVGFLDMAPPYAANRATVGQRYGGWDARCVLEKGKFDRALLGLNQRYFLPRGNAWTEVSGVKLPRLDTTEVHTLFLRSPRPLRVGVKPDNGPVYALTAQGTGEMEAVAYRKRAGRVKWQLAGCAGATFWGVAEDAPRGVAVDNFSLRGSGGQTLAEIPEENLREWNAVRPYDLIIVQFGLNVASKKQTDYSHYAAQMKDVVERLKRNFPQAGILIVGVGDREDRLADGRLHTLPGALALMRYQQNLAADCHVAFWNLYHAMGGEGGIRRMAEAHPAEAGKDYTHINRLGGERVAQALFKAIVHGHSQYHKRTANPGAD